MKGTYDGGGGDDDDADDVGVVVQLRKLTSLAIATSNLGLGISWEILLLTGKGFRGAEQKLELEQAEVTRPRPGCQGRCF